MLPPLIQLVLLSFCPSSPGYLAISRNSSDDIREALLLLRANNVCQVDAEMEEMLVEKDASTEPDMRVFKQLGSSSLRPALIICVAMYLSKQFSGMVSALFFILHFSFFSSSFFTFFFLFFFIFLHFSFFSSSLFTFSFLLRSPSSSTQWAFSLMPMWRLTRLVLPTWEWEPSRPESPPHLSCLRIRRVFRRGARRNSLDDHGYKEFQMKNLF